MKTAHRKSHKSNRKQSHAQPGPNGQQPHTGKKRAAGANSPGGRTKKGSFHGLPEIWLPENNRYLSEFASELGRILSTQEVFWRFDKCVIPKADEKAIINLAEVSPQEFRSLIENYCAPIKHRRTNTKNPEKVRHSLATEDATATLVDRGFLKRLRPVRGINQIQLPAFYGNKLQLLPLGYDPQHQIYTVHNAFDYPKNFTPKEAIKFFDDFLSEFCFFAQDRQLSQSIIIAAALTLFASHLMPMHSIRPNFLVNANSEGSGKTLLCKIPIIAMLGSAPAGTVPKDEDEMRKFIASASLSGSPIFFLDNIKGHLNSASLEALTTSPVIQFRVLGKTKLQKAEHGLTVLMSANRATFSPDLRRRTFIIELFLEDVRPERRLIKHPLDDAGIINARADILASLWAWSKPGPRPAILKPANSINPLLPGIMS
jgi:hypothetical protein